MGRVSYIVYFTNTDDSVAIVKTLEQAHTLRQKLWEMGYNATYERVEAEWN